MYSSFFSLYFTFHSSVLYFIHFSFFSFQSSFFSFLLLSFPVIQAVFHNGFHDFGIFPFVCAAVDQPEQLAASGETVVVPPAAGNSAGTGRGNEICGKVDTVLQVVAFVHGAVFVDQHRDSVGNVPVVQRIHNRGDLGGILRVGMVKCVVSIAVQGEVIRRVCMRFHDDPVVCRILGGRTV